MEIQPLEEVGSTTLADPKQLEIRDTSEVPVYLPTWVFEIRQELRRFLKKKQNVSFFSLKITSKLNLSRSQTGTNLLF